MIITCEACSTKFNLDESILKPDGSKVRCTICKHIFIASPPTDTPSMETAVPTPTAISEKPSIASPPESFPPAQSAPSASEPALEFEEEITIDDSSLTIEANEITIEKTASDDPTIGDTSSDLTEAPTEKSDPHLSVDTLGNEMNLEDELGEKFKSEDKSSQDASDSADMTFSLEDELESKEKPAEIETTQVSDEALSLELDMAGSLDEDQDMSGDLEGTSDEIGILDSTPKAEDSAASPVPELDLSLDEDVSLADQNISLDTPEPTSSAAPELELDFDFSLDDDDSPSDLSLDQVSDTPQALPSGTEGIELDLDFSLDDDAAPEPDATPSPLVSSDDDQDDLNLDLDLDFSLEDDAPTTPSDAPPLDSSFDIEEGAELDLDFSDDAGDAVSSSEISLPDDDDLDLDFSMDEDGMESDELDLDFSVDADTSDDDIDLDFSFDDEPTDDDDHGEEDTLEFELEDDTDLDLDFSSMEDVLPLPPDTDDSNGQDQLHLESPTAMDLDFSMDEELSKTPDREEIISPAEEGLKDEFRTSEYEDFDDEGDIEPDIIKESKEIEELAAVASASHSAEEESSTLSGERPHLLFEKDQEKPKKSFALGKIVVMTLFLLVVAIAGYVGAIMTGVEIPYISDLKIPFIDQYIPKPPPPPVRLTPIKKTIVSKFIEHESAGTLFVIRGAVFNQSEVVCKNIKLKCTLLDNEKKKIKTLSVLCGKKIPDDQLKTMDIKTLTTRLTTPRNSPDFLVGPSKNIPFLLVFADLPDNLATFNMTVIDFDRLPKK